MTTTAVASVRVSNLSRMFDGRPVLNGLDLTIAPNQFVALLGRSGSGKSTLLRILGGLDQEYQGDVLVPAERSMVFQEARLLPWERVLDNVSLGLGSARNKREKARARARSRLDEVGLGDRTRAWPATLSGGEAQRVALARALVREPQLILLDEPFGALDALTRTRMQTLLQALCRRHSPAVLLVTHDVDEAILLADRIAVLVDGRISLDLAVGDGRPRPGETSFAALRQRLLAELGVV